MSIGEGGGICRIDLWHLLWYYHLMKLERKVTVHLPQELLARAQGATGQGITETIRTGLQLVAASSAYETLKKLRGKVKPSLSAKQLRDDRK